jgi:hypothetical protein
MAFALAAALVCAAAEPRPSEAERSGSEWSKGNRILLGVTQERIGFSARWRFQRAAEGDILLELEETRAGQPRAGALLLVADGVLLARDVPLQRGRELDAFNGPLLMLQLVLRLLERALPAGPASIDKEVQVDLTERERPVKVTGLGADGEFYAPWSVKGRIGPGGNGEVRFELAFVSATAGGSKAAYQTSIAGIWQNASPPVQLPDAMPLRGWRGFRLQPAVVARAEANDLGLRTSPPMAFANLAAARRHAAQWKDEGARRSRWQCS